MTSERMVIVHRSFDPMQADLLGEILRDNGIAARVIGTRNAALLGVGPNALEVHISVPESQAGAATDFLEEYFRGDGAELLSEAGLLDEEELEEEATAADEDGPAPPRQLNPLVAMGCAGSVFVLGIGLGHFYARRRVTAVIVALAELAVIVGLVSQLSGSASMLWSDFVFLATTLFMLFVCDAVGAFRAAAAAGERARSGLAQLGAGLAYIVIALAVAALLAPILPQPKRTDEVPAQAPVEPIEQLELSPTQLDLNIDLNRTQ